MVSIIVPVFNVQLYLPTCIESVLSQLYRDWELLLIDDGSEDNSGSICDEYARVDSRISVIHKTNGGVSSARNRGIEKASGEWITFLDADDMLDSNTLLSCSTYFEYYDMIRFSLKYVYSDNTEKDYLFNIEEGTKNEYFAKIVARKTILGVCGGFYKSNLFKDNGIKFDERLICGEDWLVLTNLFLHAHHCKFIDSPFYHYNKFNEESATHSVRYEALYSSALAQKAIAHLVEEKGLYGVFSAPLAAGKCDLIYNFVAYVLSNRKSLTRKQFDDYYSTARLSLSEIKIADLTLRRKLILGLYSFALGRYLIKFLFTN